MSRKSGNLRHPISCLAGRTCLTTIRSLRGNGRQICPSPIEPISHRVGHSVLAVDNEATDDVADIYNQAGDDYVSYADGDPSQPFAFDGVHAYADRCVWAVLEKKLTDLRASGASSVRFLDAGCGPGTWLRRLVIRARALGFSSITARGFDIAQAQIQRARLAARNLSSLPGANLTFDVADLTDRLPEPDASVDMTLCLYSALSHLPVASLTDISTEIARVTSGYFITTVRPIGSTPTAFVEPVEKVRGLKQDHVRDRCEIDLSDGRHMAFGLYGAFFVKGASRHFGRPLHSILLFDPRREHSSVPTAYCHRRRAQRRSRTALLQRRRRLVLDGREHGGRLPAIGWLVAR